MTAIIVCTRLKSSRLPNKCAIEINGKPILFHLHERLKATGLKIIYAMPFSEMDEFSVLFQPLMHEFDAGVFDMYFGEDHDPLSRMTNAAKRFGVDTVIRVTHDKIFVDTDLIKTLLEVYQISGLEYVYSSKFVAGTGFEIISTSALIRAAEKFKNVEHISYAIRAITERQHDAYLGWPYNPRMRLLIDFPEDVSLMSVIFGILGNDCTLKQVKDLWLNTPWVQEINQMPFVTVYTCAYNSEKWIEKCMGTVSAQKAFRDCEYLLIDDCSTDKTGGLMEKFAALYKNVKYIRNTKNVGLASSCNVALSRARGNYIVRLDSDDYFTTPDAIDDLTATAIKLDVDAVYPDAYYGTKKVIQRGDEARHIGGALFSTRALNFIKFTDGLRNLEGLDLYTRAKSKLRFGYLNRAIFLYRQRPDSMSKTNLEERERVRMEIESQ